MELFSYHITLSLTSKRKNSMIKKFMIVGSFCFFQMSCASDFSQQLLQFHIAATLYGSDLMNAQQIAIQTGLVEQKKLQKLVVSSQKQATRDKSSQLINYSKMNNRKRCIKKAPHTR